MHPINEFVDERQKSWCIYCGDWIEGIETNRDHVPSKGLLRKPFPENLPVIKACTECNIGFSEDEEYLFLFLSCVQSGSTDPEKQVDPKAGRALRRHKALRRRIEQSKIEYRTAGGDTRTAWRPEIKRIERVVLKNAKGHAYYEFGEPMLETPDHVRIWPLSAMAPQEREDFETVQTGSLVSEVGSRMMTRVFTGQDISNGWVNVQNKVYRYSVEQCGIMLVRSVLFEYIGNEVFWSGSRKERQNDQFKNGVDCNSYQYELQIRGDTPKSRNSPGSTWQIFTSPQLTPPSPPSPTAAAASPAA